MTKALIYARSTTSIKGKTSSEIDDQIHRCREFAERKGFEIVSEIRVEYSDDSRLDRPWLDELMRIIANNETDVILVTDLSRISRKTDELMEIREGFEKAGVLIQAV